MLILLLPFWMWLAWLVSAKHKLVLAIVDKTVLTSGGQEHISLNWVLNHEKFTKTSTKGYNISKDYFGFFPLENEHYRIKGLERFSGDQLNRLSEDADAAYFTDTYGIYKNEWYSQKANTERSGILYGGMSSQDVELLNNMKKRHKLVIVEFNSIASPTLAPIRNKFEDLFKLKWTGWTARYFDSLDTVVNKELPHWLVNDYKRGHDGHWPFHKSGISFVNDSDQVVILEDGTHLNNSLPYIVTNSYGQEAYGLPEKIKYPFWFDVTLPDSQVNKVVANFVINVNSSGKAELARYNLPAVFPAVTMHYGNDYRFYYFSGDFCDNPISITTSYFKGISFFKWLFYNSNDPVERKSFFWNYYRPLMITILKQEYQRDKPEPKP